MSAEQERLPGDIRTTITESLGKLSEQSSLVQETITKALRDGAVDVPAIIAALELNGHLSQTMKAFLENQGQVVFPNGEQAQVSPPVNDSEVNLGEGEVFAGPKTFGELLRAKIDNELLPADKDTLLKSEIFEAAKNKTAVKKAATEEGFSVQKRMFTREEAVQILYRVFTTPGGTFKKKQQAYSMQEIKKSFVQIGNLINELSSEISYDWLQNPTVDYQTAMGLRGLVQLNKVLTGEKVVRKGRSGAQFSKKSPSPQTETTPVEASSIQSFTSQQPF